MAAPHPWGLIVEKEKIEVKFLDKESWTITAKRTPILIIECPECQMPICTLWVHKCVFIDAKTFKCTRCGDEFVVAFNSAFRFLDVEEETA